MNVTVAVTGASGAVLAQQLLRALEADVRVSGIDFVASEGALRVMLPDTFGTTQFLAGAPDWVADWTGQQIGRAHV